jgi:hemolysin activation/secretion protein
MILLTAARPGHAQQPAYPSPVDPRRIDKSFDTLRLEQRRLKPPPSIPTVANPTVRGDTRPLFKLAGVSLRGARAIAPADISAIYRPYIGRTVSQADLAAIAAGITELYRAAGFHLTRAIVPPQDIKNGRITIQVIEGSVADVVLSGQGGDQFGIRPLLDVIATERPSQRNTLERQLLLANDTPGVRVADTALEEIGTLTGRFRLIVTVETWRIFTAQGYDNLGTSAVGRSEAFLTTAFNSYFMPGDSLTFNGSTVPSEARELTFGRLTYDAPVGTDGARLGASALYSDVWPNDNRRQTHTHTTTETYAVKGTIVPLQTRTQALWLTAAMGFSEVTERNTLGAAYNDHLRFVSLTADYRLHDELEGWNYLTLTLNQGLDVLGASTSGDDFMSRGNAPADFTILNYGYTRYQKLSDVWSVKIATSGQQAFSPLLSSMQFYIGNGAYGPGFYSGDNGFAGAAELRLDQLLPYAMLKGYQIYGFMDGGAVWNVNSSGDTLSLSSAGAGVRFYIDGTMQAGFAVAWPLHIGTTADEIRGPRYLFSLSNAFKLCPERPEMRCS